MSSGEGKVSVGPQEKAPGSESNEKKADERQTLVTRMADLALAVACALGMPSYLVLDAFYAANTLFERVAPVVDAQQQRWAHVIVKGKRSYVGYREVPPVTGKRPVGRPPEYGENRNWSSGCTPPGSRSKAH